MLRIVTAEPGGDSVPLVNDAARLHEDHFGSAPDLTLRAPGRINLIGDHTDYCGLPVLPMAIAEGIDFAVSEGAAPFTRATSTLDGATFDSRLRIRPLGWARYVSAALAELASLAPDRGARIAIDGDLPPTGGLSSSSALTVGCVFALASLWNVEASPAELVELAVAAERRAAIAGGAMDQTVIAHATPGNALRIDFDPPHLRHVAIPDSFRWIAAYSGTKAPKGDEAGDSYNSFVLASRAAARLLGDESASPQLSRVREATAESQAELPTITVAAAAELVDGDDLGLPRDALLDLRISAEHVLAEGSRVDAAELALASGDAPLMGRLMLESHESLRRYGSSTPGLDLLVAAAVDAGAHGARVTGAGFGGWAVALADPDTAGAVHEAMERACGGPAFIAEASGGVMWSLSGR